MFFYVIGLVVNIEPIGEFHQYGNGIKAKYERAKSNAQGDK
jgi:hypothetical protein